MRNVRSGVCTATRSINVLCIQHFRDIKRGENVFRIARSRHYKRWITVDWWNVWRGESPLKHKMHIFLRNVQLNFRRLLQLRDVWPHSAVPSLTKLLMFARSGSRSRLRELREILEQSVDISAQPDPEPTAGHSGRRHAWFIGDTHSAETVSLECDAWVLGVRSTSLLELDDSEFRLNDQWWRSSAMRCVPFQSPPSALRFCQRCWKQ